LIPYRDENVTVRTPIVTIVLIAINVLVWLLVQGAGSPASLARSVCNLGLIPGELTGLVPVGSSFPMGEDLVCATDPGRGIVHVLTSMFLHGSWMHLIGNMWFLWIFGDNVEDSMGHVRYVVFYLIGGVAAAALQVAVNPDSIVPMVGASGAISAVMGGYLALYPRVRVFTLLPLGFFFTTIAVPAYVMLVYWAVIQFVSGTVSLGQKQMGGVAFWAHMGGFVIGLVLAKLFAKPELVREHAAHHWRPRRMGFGN
jgi:membrane associated rhomboid family serine protease